MLFIEMWTNDDEGFPMPDGCYYSKEFERGANTELYDPHYGIVFGAGNGLKHVCKVNGQFSMCEYMIVINVKSDIKKEFALGGSREKVLADLYTMCLGRNCPESYLVYEKGQGFATKGTDMSSQGGGPRWGTSTRSLPTNLRYGFTLKGRNKFTEELDLTGSIKFQAELNGDENNQIKPRSIIRVFLWPLTLWDLGAQCTVECIPATFPEGKSCGGLGGAEIDCTPLPVADSVAGRNRHNMMKVVL